MDILEFASDFTLSKKPIRGIVDSPALFKILFSRNDPKIRTNIPDLPTVFGDGFCNISRQLKIPQVYGFSLQEASSLIFSRGRILYLCKTLLQIRHTFLTPVIAHAICKMMNRIRGSERKTPDDFIVSAEQVQLDVLLRLCSLKVSKVIFHFKIW